MPDQSQTALPLSRFNVFESASIDQAREFVTGVFCDHALQPLQRTMPMPTRMHHVKLRDTSANYLSYGCSVRITPCEIESFYLLQVPIRGQATVVRGRESVLSLPGSATLLAPHDQVDMRWAEGCEQILLRVQRQAMESLLEAMLGAPLTKRLTFSLPLRLDQGPLLTLWKLLESLYQDLETNPRSAYRTEAGATPLEQLALSLLLAHAPHSYSADLQQPVAALAPYRIRLVEEYIAAHFNEPISIQALTGAAGVSARTLFENYQQYRGMSPMKFVQQYRYQKARAALRQADAGASVTSIALDCGITQLGRFAAHYRRLFGETPSETLRQGRLKRLPSR